ncbi:hypothetical protein [Candidatus Poriferisodalis sp.]|uniref:hypothetical protein n=1 Tax=Candidatus Poriferisodalis sp. TaxID=3101277 RepID=UPI003B5A3AF2
MTSQPETATVAELKELLADPACRIELHDFIGDETLRTIDAIQNADCEGYDECLRAYEHASANLIKLLVAGSYYSDCADHDKAWAHAVRLLANRISYATSDHGTAINLKHHVTLLAIYAVAFGATAADRIDSIARIIGTVRAEEDGRVGRVTYLVNCDQLKRPEEAPIQASLRLWMTLRSMTDEFIPKTQEDALFDAVLDEIEYLLGVTHGRDTAEGTGPVGYGAIQVLATRVAPDRLVRRNLDTLIAHDAFQSVDEFYICRDRYNRAYAAEARV